MNAIYIGRKSHANLSYGMTGEVAKKQPILSLVTGAIYAFDYSFHPHGFDGEQTGIPIWFHVDFTDLKIVN